MNFDGYKETEIGLIPEEWKVKPLKEICSLITDGKHGDCENEEGSGYFFLSVKDVLDNRLVYDNARQITKEDFLETHRRTNLEVGDVLFTNTGTIGRMAIATDDPRTKRTTFQKSVAILKPKRNIVLPYFLYYMLKFNNKRLSSFAEGTTQKNLLLKDFRTFDVVIPSIHEQFAITNKLFSLDKKIELNNQMNQTLEALGQAIFRHWFIDFEFPDENGQPYKSGGGEMVDSELGKIPQRWEIGTLGDIVNNFDSKRVPLSRHERESKKGEYPYFGATKIMDYVDDYIFDGIHILMAEDGSVIDKNERPVLQYVWGKFWVNNHTHVLKGKKGFSEEYIYLLLKNTNISHLVSGAVQLKINQKNMNSLKIVIPDFKTLKIFSIIMNSLFSHYRLLTEETITLSKIRDFLLPKLMSGKIRVPTEDKP
jgi:type I restriction enzyme S subunit